jgi:ADP-heptose:LPS heptosyltransferase
LVSTSAKQLYALACQGAPLPADGIRQLAQTALSNATESAALFRDFVEPLADSFAPQQVDRYVEAFARMIETANPRLQSASIIRRYQHIRQAQPLRLAGRSVTNVVVLSRVTIGADICITSMFLHAARLRFPAARIFFAGPEKNYRLFSAAQRIEHLPAEYPRHGTLAEKLLASARLHDQIAQLSGALVLDPDSRFSQLGLLPMAPEDRTIFFESRTAGVDSDHHLADLTRDFLHRVLGVAGSSPWFETADVMESPTGAWLALSLGTGGNPAKDLGPDFEAKLLTRLGETGLPMVIDCGAGGEEKQRAEQAVIASRLSPSRIHLQEGSFSSFAAVLHKARGFIGYDSAAGHAAAAAGTPMVSIAKGFANERMRHRWAPDARGPLRILNVDEYKDDDLVDRIVSALKDVSAL